MPGNLNTWQRHWRKKCEQKPKDPETMKKGNEEYRGQSSNTMAEVEPYWKSLWGQQT
jgi:hypothetical protein